MINKKKLEYIKNLYFKHGIPLKSINLFGIRNEEKQKKDIWNDIIGFFTEDKIYFYKGTTDPGYYWTLNPSLKQGTAHLCLGYHNKIWKISKHRGKYTALCNRWKCNKTRIWRDINKDTKFDKNIEKFYKGHFGINLHRASALYLLNKIGKFSAGCQVLQDSKNFNFLISKCIESKQKYFSYFLFDKSQIAFFEKL